MDWFDLLTVQGTLKSLLQHHSSKASILRHSAVFTVQLSHPYTTTGKTIALTRQTFVGEVMSLPFNMLSMLVRSKSWSTGVSASASVLPMNIQDWFPLGWTSLISLQSKGLSTIFSNTTVQKKCWKTIRKTGNYIRQRRAKIQSQQLPIPWVSRQNQAL